MTDIWAILLSGAFGVLLGALLSGLVQVVVGRYESFHEGKAVASAIRAEIVTTIDMWNRMSWDKGINDVINRLRIPRYTPTADDFFTFLVNEKPFQVFDSLCNKIGLLGDLGAPITHVYVLGKAFFTNVGILWDLREKHIAKQITTTREALLNLTEGVAEFLRDFLEKGKKTADALAVYERRRWLRR